jgi:ketosteroid isomerase-like protein
MSVENAELVRRFYGRLNAGDAEGVIELCDAQFVMDMTERVFNPDRYEGADGIRRFLRDVQEAWQSYHWEVEETRARDDAVVVAMLHCRGESRHGGPEVEWRVAWLFRFEGGTPVSLRFYRKRDDALEAAGLAE